MSEIVDRRVQGEVQWSTVVAAWISLLVKFVDIGACRYCSSHVGEFDFNGMF